MDYTYLDSLSALAHNKLKEGVVFFLEARPLFGRHLSGCKSNVYVYGRRAYYYQLIGKW